MGSLIVSAVALFLFMTALFGIAMRLNNNGVADVGYGIAFIVVIMATVLQVWPLNNSQLLIVVLAVVWGLRLAYRVGRKNLHKPEDFRYAAWRRDWGETFVVRSYVQIYMLQGVIVFLIALPVLLMLAYPAIQTSALLIAMGAIIWAIGFAFEAISDAQLDRFVADKANRGKIMTNGLWRYSRHPNYFGESLMWWGIALACASLTTFPVLCFLSPLLITFLLLKVSGVPMLEKRWKKNPAWEDYKRRTSVFVPLPPRR